MLSILDCSPGSRPAIGSRRELLRVGGLAFGGLSLPGLLGGRSVTHAAPEPGLATSFGRAKSVIVMFLGGGPPQHESWDPKPEAPPEIRGGFGSIDSATPGLRVGELMPLTATLTDQIAVLRAMVTNDNAHSSSGYQMMTGVPHVPLSPSPRPPTSHRTGGPWRSTSSVVAARSDFPRPSPCQTASPTWVRLSGRGRMEACWVRSTTPGCSPAIPPSLVSRSPISPCPANCRRSVGTVG
jgi:hypothetical protein